MNGRVHLLPLAACACMCAAAHAQPEYAWVRVPTGVEFTDIAVVSRDDAWGVENVATDEGADCSVLHHYDGLSWSAQERVDGIELMHLFAYGAHDVWACGEREYIYHYDGAGWSQQHGGTTAEFLTDFSALSAGNVYAVGWSGWVTHFDGGRWQWLVTGVEGDTLYGIHAVDTSSIWAVGNKCTVRRSLDGGVTWTGGQIWEQLGLTAHAALYDVAALSNDNVWVVGHGTDQWSSEDGSIIHWNGTSWELTKTDYLPLRIHAVSAGSIWVSGLEGMRHWDGSSWREQNNGILHNEDGLLPFVGSIGVLDATHPWVAATDAVYFGEPAKLTLTPSKLVTGQKFALELKVVEPLTKPFDFYMFVEAGSAYFTISLNGAITPGIKPLFSNVPAYHDTASFIIRPGVVLPSGIEHNVLNFYAVAVEAGRIPPVSAISDLEANTPYVIGLGKKSGQVYSPGE